MARRLKAGPTRITPPPFHEEADLSGRNSFANWSAGVPTNRKTHRGYEDKHNEAIPEGNPLQLAVLASCLLQPPLTSAARGTGEAPVLKC